MLCYLVQFLEALSFWQIWLLVQAATIVVIYLSSGYAFYKLYAPSQVSHSKWQYKSSEKFPSVLTVRKEIEKTSKGAIFATILPSLSIYLRDEKYMHCYCGEKNGGLSGNDSDAIAFFPSGEEMLRRIFQFAVVVAFTDFYEFAYHYLGHKCDLGWVIH